MQELRNYIFSIIVAALICGTVSGLTQNFQGKQAIRLLAGVLLASTLLKPVLTIKNWKFPQWDALSQNASDYVTEGKNAARSSWEDIIKEKTEAYILDKAAELGLTIQAEVRLDKQGIPVGVQLCGKVTADLKSKLETYIDEQIGITKENQIWTGQMPNP